MTKEEFINHIKKELQEELEGILNYNDLYEGARTLNLCDEADEIEYIAGEEYHHACVLKDILHRHGYSLRNLGMNALWEKVESIFND